MVFVPNCLRAERKHASPPSEERWPCLQAADADLLWPSGPPGSSSNRPLALSSWRSSAAVGWCCHPAEEIGRQSVTGSVIIRRRYFTERHCIIKLRHLGQSLYNMCKAKVGKYSRQEWAAVTASTGGIFVIIQCLHHMNPTQKKIPVVWWFADSEQLPNLPDN